MMPMYPRRCTLATALIVALLGQAEIGLGAYDRAADSLPLTDNSKGTLSLDGTHLIIKMDPIELNALKKSRNIATLASGANTFASAEAGLVADLAAVPNPSVAVTEANANLVRNFQEDITHPELDQYELNMDEGFLDLWFSETVKVENIHLDSFTLYSEESTPDLGSDARQNYTLSTEGDPGEEDGTFIRVLLTNDDLNGIKRLKVLASTKETTYLGMAETAITDMNDNDVVPIDGESAKLAFKYVEDGNVPSLDSCHLNMDSAELTLLFSETVDVGKTVCQSLHLYGDETYSVDNSNVFTVGADCIVEDNSTYSPSVVVVLSDDDMNVLKAHTNIATAGKDASTPNTFCGIAPGGITDMSLNFNTIEGIAKEDAVGASFSPDRTPPTLITFDLNIDSGELTLTFSETVKASTVVAGEHITFTDEENVPSLGSFTLGGGTATIPTVESPIVTIPLTLIDMNEIKRLTHIGTKKLNSVMTITAASFAKDMEEIILVFSPTTKIPANTVTVDATPPTLDSASIHMDTRTLTLEFSETIASSELNISEFVLVNGQNGDTTYQLTGYDSISADGNSIGIVLTVIDMNEIKAKSTLFSDAGTSYIQTVGAAAPFEDMYGIPAVQIATSDAVGPLGWSADVTPPQLASWSVSIDKKKLWLTFDETVYARDFDQTHVTLHGSSSGAGQKYPLTNQSSVAADHAHSTIVEVTIGNDDMNEIKAREGLLVGVGTSYLQLGSGAVSDMEGISVVEVEASTPTRLSADGYEGDKTAPVFLGYKLDMDLVKPLLTLFFDETVRLTSVNASQIKFVGTQGEEFSLRSIEMKDVNAATVSGEISVLDSNLIKGFYNLATLDNLNTNSLTLGVGAFTDMRKTSLLAGHQNEEKTLAISLNGYKVDQIAPILVSYTLDMTDQILSMTFAETVNPTIDPAKFSLVDSVGSAVRLSDSHTESGTGTVIDIKIHDMNADDIKLDPSIAANKDNTLLTVDAGAISDTAGNSIEAIDSMGVASLGYTRDNTPPKLLSMAVNMDRSVNGAAPDANEVDVNAATITFNFDEPVDAIGGFAATSVTLVATDDVNVVDPAFHKLLEVGMWTQTNGRQVTLTLDTKDLNTIKKKSSLFAEFSSSYVTIEGTLVNDMAGNPVQSETAKQVDAYDEDTTDPTLAHWDLDMENGVLTLSFKETVDASTLTQGAITLQKASTVDVGLVTSWHTLDGGLRSVQDDKTLTITFTVDDLNELKRKKNWPFKGPQLAGCHF
jgi:hypothetical protein